MPFFRRRFARLLAVLALVAGVLGTALPAAADSRPMQMSSAEMHHMAMDCDHGTRPQPPAHHRSGADDCCVASVCAMSLALPAAPSGMRLPAFAGEPDYDLPILHQPAGITAAPIPHPPKPQA